jgi:multiple sugar transport system permease protein
MKPALPFREQALGYTVLAAVTVVLLLPFVYMLSISLSSDKTVAENAFSLWPHEARFDNYSTAFSNPAMPWYLFNSIVLCALAIVGQTVSSSLVAYGFARFRVRAKGLIFMVLLATMMIPGEITMIPQFLIFKELGWLDTLLPLIVPNFFGGAFNIFLLRQVMMSIPYSFDEAAKMEGAGPLLIWRTIIVPMIKPTLVAVDIFTFAYNWGWFTGPLIYITSQENYPLALGAYFMTSTFNKGAIPPWNLIMVASMFLTVPMILVYTLGQKYVYSANIGSNDIMK